MASPGAKFRALLGENAILAELRRWLARLGALEQQVGHMQMSLGRIEMHLQALRGIDKLADREFKVTSQWGEDGVLQALVARLPAGPKRFVEFGVENYRESNTRFLLQHGHWSGLVLDGSAEHIAEIERDNISWRHDLRARQAFVTRENIDALLTDNGFAGELDLLSIDVDGNDYWIWDAITVARPRIVVVEYNSVFGPNAACTIPYRADFQRSKAHPSNLYYGASVAALAKLGDQRGYRLVHGNRAGNNVFFVRDDFSTVVDLPSISPAQAWVRSSFREARHPDGSLAFARADERIASISSLPVVNVATGETVPLRTLL